MVRSTPKAAPKPNPFAPSRLRARQKVPHPLQRSHRSRQNSSPTYFPLRSWRSARVASASPPYRLSSATASISSGPAPAATATTSAAKPSGKSSAEKAGPPPWNARPTGSDVRGVAADRYGWGRGRERTRESSKRGMLDHHTFGIFIAFCHTTSLLKRCFVNFGMRPYLFIEFSLIHDI